MVSCPTCHKEVPEPAGPIPKGSPFPFCSERCRLIDLGRWLDEKHQIPVVEADEEEGIGGEGSG